MGHQSTGPSWGLRICIGFRVLPIEISESLGVDIVNSRRIKDEILLYNNFIGKSFRSSLTPSSVNQCLNKQNYKDRKTLERKPKTNRKRKLFKSVSRNYNSNIKKKHNPTKDEAVYMNYSVAASSIGSGCAAMISVFIWYCDCGLSCLLRLGLRAMMCSRSFMRSL